jgi:hypothetical protein
MDDRWGAHAEVRHFRKLFGGCNTALEVHAMCAWRGRCLACGGPPVVRCKVFVLAAELIARHPELCARIAVGWQQVCGLPAPQLPLVDTRWGAMVLISDTVACAHHRKQAEVAAAHPPRGLDCFVWIDRGPDEREHSSVQVPLGYSVSCLDRQPQEDGGLESARASAPSVLAELSVEGDGVLEPPSADPTPVAE